MLEESTQVSPTAEPSRTIWRRTAWYFLSFDGRISRRDYAIAFAVLALTMFAVQSLPGISDDSVRLALKEIHMAALAWVWLAICSKRWHDRGKSGWWNLLMLVPVLGWFWLIVECSLLPGQDRANRYGPKPATDFTWM